MSSSITAYSGCAHYSIYSKGVGMNRSNYCSVVHSYVSGSSLKTPCWVISIEKSHWNLAASPSLSGIVVYCP